MMDFGSSEAGKKGGKARKEALTPEQRSEIARKAVESRWEKQGKLKNRVPMATHGSPDRPLKIGDIEVSCYVLEDQRRVIVQKGMMTALNMSQGTAGRGDGDRLGRFVSTKALNPFVDKGLRDVIINPIKFRVGGGNIAYGYEATILADLCDAVLRARAEGKLHYQQEHIAKQCEILVRGFARVGIIALIDEATGYQDDRDRNALAKILEAFVAKELRPWVHTFPVDYYRELYRLRGLTYPPKANKMPRYIGTLTNDIVYKRLAPGVLGELRRMTPRDSKGRLKHHLHRRLTDDVGHPKLLQHLGAVVAVMRFADDTDYAGFIKMLDKHYPRQNLVPAEDLPLLEGKWREASPDHGSADLSSDQPAISQTGSDQTGA